MTKKGPKPKEILSALGQVDELLVFMDPNGVIEYVNDAVLRISGFSAGELIGKPVDVLDFPAVRPEQKHRSLFERLRETGYHNGEIRRHRYRTRDGGAYDVDAAFYAVYDAEGHICRYVSWQRPAKMTETARRQISASKMEAIGALITGLAHEFNNIFTPLLGYAQLARSEAESDLELKHNIDMIIKATGRAKELVKKTLAFTRFSEGGDDPVDMAALLRETVTALKAEVPEGGVVQLVVSRPVGPVVGTEESIRQIIGRLADNALEAIAKTPRAKICFTLENCDIDDQDMIGYPELRSSNCARFTVRDNGPGIPAAVIHRVFDPFFTTKKYGEGAGVGLSIVQGIVKSLGGIIGVRSEEGEETVFTVLLPRYRERGDGAAISSAAAAPKTRVLCVCQDKAAQARLKAVLGRADIVWRMAENGKDAVGYFNEHPDAFDAVILNKPPEQLDRGDIVATLKQTRPEIPILFIVSKDDRVSTRNAAAFFEHHYLVEPFTPAKLAELLLRIVAEAKTKQEIVVRDNPDNADTARVPKDIGDMSGHKGVVLLVDSDAMILDFFSETLIAAGYGVITLSRPDKIRETLEKNAVDVLLIDYGVTGGANLTRELKGLYPNLEIIIAAAALDLKNAVHTIRYGATDYLAKPFSRDELIQAVEAASRQQVWRQRVTDAVAIAPPKGYRVIRSLGAGSNGAVTLVEKDQRLFAMKTLHQREDAPADAQGRRFLMEADILSRLDEPGIVKIYEYGQLPDSDIPYLIMEYLTGKPLTCYLGDNRLSFAEKTRVFARIAEILAFIHRHRVVHRDIKPGNVIILGDGQVKLTDFGAARFIDPTATVTQSIIGSPAYMAPERFLDPGEKPPHNESVGDIFSLGVLAYELYSGKRPFVGQGLLEVIEAIRSHKPEPLTEVIEGFPPELWAAIASALVKDPKKRCRSAATLSRELKNIWKSLIVSEKKDNDAV